MTTRCTDGQVAGVPGGMYEINPQKKLWVSLWGELDLPPHRVFEKIPLGVHAAIGSTPNMMEKNPMDQSVYRWTPPVYLEGWTTQYVPMDRSPVYLEGWTTRCTDGRRRCTWTAGAGDFRHLYEDCGECCEEILTSKSRRGKMTTGNRRK